jgi:hypothetical protein
VYFVVKQRNMPKIITREHIERIRLKHSILWSISDHKRLDKTKRYEYLCKCQCGKFQWVKWRKLSTGNATGCRSCTKSNAVLPRRRNHPLKKVWYGMMKRVRRGRAICLFRDFDHFMDWSLFNSWRIGSRLRRRDTLLPYSATNCYWDNGSSIGARRVTHVMLAKELGVTPPTIRYWLGKGLELTEIIKKFKEKM